MNGAIALQISRSEAALIYARACRAWYGTRALAVAKDKVHQLKRRGDAAGVDIWTKVAGHIAELNRKPHHLVAEARGKLY